jgi:hypothetical protein
MDPTHTISSINYADVWHIALTLIGLVLILSGVVTAVYTEFTWLGRKSLIKIQ